MTRVGYFQRYSKRENHVTNNTLLILRHFYQASPHKVRDVFSELADADISIGLTFQQQVKESSSVPDALISQLPLSIYIETKLEARLESSQLTRHIASISGSTNDRSKKILFVLTTEPIEKGVHQEIVKQSKEEGIIFASRTFLQVIQSLRSVCKDYEENLTKILDDYENYLEEEDLLQIGNVMSVYPCGTSLSENLDYRLYFQPSYRSSKWRSKFIGLYGNKTVSHLAEINSVVVGYYSRDEERFIVEDIEKGELSEEQKVRIVKAGEACTYFGNFAEYSHRYYLFDEVYETNFQKPSWGPIRNLRNFDLSEWLDYKKQRNYSASEVAQELCGEHWE